MAETPPIPAKPPVKFGGFHLYPEDRRLMVDGAEVDIGGRAFEILQLLASSPGHIISHKEFRQRVWPDTVVEDGNLRVHIATLRKILAQRGDGSLKIRSVSGRGYRLIGGDASANAHADALPDEENLSDDDGLGLIGRSADIRAIRQLLSDRNSVSIVGPGGIGKTSVAQAVMEEIRASRKEPAVTIELSSVGHPDHLASTIASAFGLLTPSMQAPLDAVIDFLRTSPHIVLLDCCEHIIDAVANTVETLKRSLKTMTILTTSREPLRVSEERVYRLPALSVPRLSESHIPAVAIRYSAVKLFAARAASAQGNVFSVSVENVREVCEICRTLDGIPLAIELAASQMPMLGTRKLLQALENRFEFLTRGQRTALPRHKTLRATMDWSYETLTEEEGLTLRQLALFKTAFTLEQAKHVLGATAPGRNGPLACLATLVDKSLVLAMTDAGTPRFRLLDSTRTYGLEKLRHCGEYDVAAEAYARYFLSLFTEPAEWSADNAAVDPLANDEIILDDVRQALVWTLSSPGNISLGVALTWASAPLFYQLSLFDEYRQRVNKALLAIDASGDGQPDAVYRLQLALAQADFLTQPLQNGIAAKAFHAALTLAELYRHEARQAEVLYGAIVMTVMAGDYQGADALCRRLGALTQAGNASLPLFHRLRALVDIQTGALEQALRNAQLSLSLYGPRRLAPTWRDPARYDARSVLTSLESRALWLAGYVDDAADAAVQSVEETMTLRHDLSLCCSLASGACPVACWRGDIAELELYLDMLESLSAKRRLTHWRDQALCYGYGLPDRQPPHGYRWWQRFDHMAPSAHETLATVNSRLLTPLAIERAKSGLAGWATAEILRALGEHYLENDPERHPEPEHLFRQALAIARSQGARAFELRAATSLARSLRTRHCLTEAEDVLSTPLSCFTQGFDTRDLRTARGVLEGIHLDRKR